MKYNTLEVLYCFFHSLYRNVKIRVKSQKVRQGIHPDMKINKEKLYYNDVKGILNSKNVFECIVFHLKVEGLKIHFIDIISL